MEGLGLNGEVLAGGKKYHIQTYNLSARLAEIFKRPGHLQPGPCPLLSLQIPCASLVHEHKNDVS